ncbi:MAG: patatin-like phospholipase family protein, partial [Thermoanaerobaculales bacterium]|nr:patatin-like phospholipase family protein [Thermoanaerobaculales bacterium]
DPAAHSPANDAPELVLVLSGGGARGAAHIGVLRVLEEMQIAPDMIVGTSMGSIVGGLYAAGWSPDEIEELLVSIDWNQVFTDKVPRNDLSFRRKQDDRPYLIKARLHFDEDGFYLPAGLLSGQSLEILLETLEARSRPERDFDRLPIPFRAVATDIENGEAVVLDSGSLARAMRTSMSIPGMFPPVKYEGRTLIDGGSVANLPIGIAQSLGAEHIIAVDISSPMQSPDMKLKNFWDVYNRLNSLLTVGNRRTDVSRLRQGDVMIRPDLGDIGFLDFDRATETVALGDAATRAAADQLRPLAGSPSQRETFFRQQRRPPTPMIHIDRVRFEGAGLVKDPVALTALNLQTPVDLDPEDLRRDIMRLYHLRHSGVISFRVDEVDGLRELVINAPAPPYGRHSFQIGLGLFDDFDGNGAYSFGVRHQMLPANRHDGEWQTILDIGSSSRLFSEFYQPLGNTLRWFVVPSISISRIRQDIWIQGEPLATYHFGDQKINVAGGYVLGNHSEIRLAAFYSDNTFDLQIGDPILPDLEEDRAGFELRFYHDTEDSVMFPRSGSEIDLRVTRTLEAIGSDNEMTQFSLKMGRAWSFGKYTVVPYLEYRENREPATNFADFFFLGGPGRLSGLGFRELYGNTLAFARIQSYRRMKKIDLAGIAIRLYAGISLEAGNTFFYDHSVSLDDFLYGGTAFIGAETPIGPLYLGYGYTEGGRDRWYLAIGNHF